MSLTKIMAYPLYLNKTNSTIKSNLHIPSHKRARNWESKKLLSPWTTSKSWSPCWSLEKMHKRPAALLYISLHGQLSKYGWNVPPKSLKHVETHINPGCLSHGSILATTLAMRHCLLPLQDFGTLWSSDPANSAAGTIQLLSKIRWIQLQFISCRKGLMRTHTPIHYKTAWTNQNLLEL